MPEVILSDYFYGDESEEFIYFKIPRLLITDQKFKHVSTDAKLLYGMLLDRMGLSAKNNWYDDSGRVYIYYTVDEICQDMCRGRDKAMKLLAELDRGKGIGLIERIKQGQGRPTKLYVKRFTTRTAPPKPAPPTPRDFLPNSDVDFSDVQRSEKSTSRSRKSRRPEVEKTDPNHTKKNHPDFSHPDPSIPPLSSPSVAVGIDRYEQREEVKANIDFEILRDAHPYDDVESLLELVVDVLCSTAPTMRIAGEVLPTETVKERFRKLDSSHIEYIIEAMSQTTTNKQDPISTVAELEAKVKAGETISLTELAAAEKAERQAKQDKKTLPASAGKDKPDTPQPAPVVVTSAAKGPAGTMISQVLPERLSPPDEAAKKDFPSPKEGESIFVTLHPAYLVKSEYNTISVDPKSEDYQELKKSIELNGVKDPVLARIGDAGTLEIVSGQRRHMIATELNYPVPTIIQKISDPDVKILVADGNLHRPKISTHDLARSLRMKMEGMKQKSGRRKKGTFKAEELDSDVKLAQEMGMPVSKLNRLIRLSEATKGVCDRVDDGSLTLSVASALSFLKPKNQDNVLHLMDLGYKVPAERVEYMKKVEKAGKLDEESMQAVLDGKNVLDPPKQEAPQAPQAEQPQPSAPAPSTIPPSPDVPQPEGAPAASPQPTEGQNGPAPVAPSVPAPTEGQPQESKDPFEGKQERPEHTKVILAGDRLRKYFPDVMMTPREIEESIYDALEERRQCQQKEKEKLTIFPKRGPKR